MNTSQSANLAIHGDAEARTATSGLFTSISSTEFNRWASEAKRAANKGPVFITDRGRPAHVLLSFAAYRQLTQQRRNIADALAMEEMGDVDFDPPRVHIRINPAQFA